ncbi:MAG: glycoside hydrolase family 5 protein [Candidatus Onthomonas sp.]
MIFEHFRNGINLGGWLSQYDCLSAPVRSRSEMAQHLETFLTEKNIAQIAGWGMDHVRLPVDYRVLEPEPDSLTDAETALACLDRCADWCERYHLNLIIDLHHAAGNVYGMMERPMPLLTEEAYQLRFLRIWEKLARHFAGRKRPILLFELLNEVSDGAGYLWNRLYRRTVSAIRAIDPERGILIGSNEQNSPFRLKELELLEDEHVYYNFHFYDPQVFTHQMAGFSEEMSAYNQSVTYPGDISGFTAFLMKNRQYLPKYVHVATEKRVSREDMARLLKDAFDFAKWSGRELYCGEFGVIINAGAGDAAGWLCDCMQLLEGAGIGHAIWNYKDLAFGFVDLDNQIVSEARLKQVCARRMSHNGRADRA